MDREDFLLHVGAAHSSLDMGPEAAWPRHRVSRVAVWDRAH